MLMALALLGCNPDATMEDDVDIGVVPTAHAGAESPPGAMPMATRTTDVAAPPIPEPIVTDAPAGSLVVQDCYGSGEARRGGRPALGSSGPVGGPPPARQPLSPPPVPRAKGMADGASGGPPMAVSPEMPAAEPPPPPPEAKPAKEKREVLDEEEHDDRDGGDEVPLRQGSVDWGAKVYLSNDDSMSLASAQRVLWAVDQGRGLSASEVRPHELLNYFSFDTVPVAQGSFSVLGAAEQRGETLSVAFAVQGAKPPRQPLDLSLVIDRSGSMRAEGRMEYVKRGLTLMTDQLRDGDRVDLTLFDTRVCSPVQNFVVGRDDPAVLARAIQQMRPRGGTDLDAGLREGYRIQTSREPGDTHRRNRRVLLLTDAFLNTGNVDEDLVSEIGKRFDEDGIRVTGIGVGREFNDTMLDRITEKGKGAYVYLGSEAVVDRVFGSGFDSLVQTLAHDVHFSVDLPESLAMERFYGEEASTDKADVQPIHYYAGTSQVFLQDLKIKPGALERSDPVVFTVEYRDAASGEPEEQVFTTTVGALLDGDRHNLDKARALMAWTDLVASRALGDRSCSGLTDYRRAAARVQGDAEIAYVSSLTGRMCGVDMSETIAATGVKYKVRVDSDIPIPEVRLSCAGESRSKTLSGGNVASFADVPSGTCELTLVGTVPMRARVDVPETGATVRCLVRGGRMQCG